MPISVIPAVTFVRTIGNETLNVKDLNVANEVEILSASLERALKQLEQITGLELEEGDI